MADGAITPRSDPVAIVTGGSVGIGREIVGELASRRYAVIVVYLDGQSSADAAVEAALAARAVAFAVRADLTDSLDVERLFTESIAACGRVDVVVHTTLQGASLLYRHAVRYLRHGAAIVALYSVEVLTPVVARALRERDVTINGVPPGLEPPGACHGAADLLACLDRWRRRPVD